MAKVNAVRSIDFGVTDVAARQKFYTEIWGLRTVAESGGAVYLRGTGPFHHIIALHQRPQAEILRIDLATDDKASVEALARQVREAGATEIEAPAPIAEPGGGYGFAFKDPEGRTLRVLCGAATHADAKDDRDRPRKISHCVMQSPDREAICAFYERGLGFRLSDYNAAMSFIRCNSDHHSIAFVKGHKVALHHIAFEMPEIEGVMRGAGRMRDHGFPIEWGVGRHGAGNNVFAYFAGPEEFPLEYSGEMLQIDESYAPHGPEYWRWPKGRLDQWGVTPPHTARWMRIQNLFEFTPDAFRL